MAIRYILLGAMSFILLSCTKNKNIVSNNPQDKNSFLPADAGSEWHYQDTTFGSYTLIALGRDTTTNGITLAVYEHKPDNPGFPTSFEYMGHDTNNNYYAIGFFTQLVNSMVLYLKADAATNTTWIQNTPLNYPLIGGGQTNVELKFTIAQTGISQTVNGNTFSNVTDVSYLIYLLDNNNNPADSTFSGNLFVAKGVGLVLFTLEEQGTVIQQTALTSYTIK